MIEKRYNTYRKNVLTKRSERERDGKTEREREREWKTERQMAKRERESGREKNRDGPKRGRKTVC